MKRTTYLLICTTLLIAALVSPGQSNTNKDMSLKGSPADQQFSSPEQTWTLYKNALLQGNYELAIKCCCPDKTKQVLIFERMSELKRQRILQNMISIEKISQQKDKAKYQMVRKVNGVDVISYVYFARIDNEWKIDDH
jgi:hypothetical protein